MHLIVPLACWTPMSNRSMRRKTRMTSVVNTVCARPSIMSDALKDGILLQLYDGETVCVELEVTSDVECV